MSIPIERHAELPTCMLEDGEDSMGDVHIRRAGQDLGVDLTGAARLLADRPRAGFCVALLDGRAWTAIEPMSGLMNLW
ncbi:MAG TPA: hypothetical protein VIS09_04500 [Streptomyces sp.]